MRAKNVNKFLKQFCFVFTPLLTKPIEERKTKPKFKKNFAGGDYPSTCLIALGRQ